MNFLKKIISAVIKQPDFNEIDNNIAGQKLKRSVFDFFEIDIRSIPDDSFIAGETITNESGDKIQKFRKTLSYKECGIFDTIEVRVFESGNKNVSLMSFNANKVNINSLKKLIDDLYLIHGTDSQDRGKFTSTDNNEYYDVENSAFFGRRWDDPDKYKFPVSIDRDEEQISISLWGVN